VDKIVEKAVCKSVFLTILHCILSTELTKTHSFRLFFGDFDKIRKANVNVHFYSPSA